MKHTFTDEQIYAAKHLAASRMNRDWISRFNVKDIRAFLDALPEPAQQHPEIEFDDVRKGDRIDVLTIHGNREILTVEARTDVHLLAMGTQIQATNYVQSIRLISRPAQHPDPDVHKYILDVDGDLWIWSKSQRKYIEPETLVQSAPAEFDEWTPGKVVEDDR